MGEAFLSFSAAQKCICKETIITSALLGKPLIGIGNQGIGKDKRRSVKKDTLVGIMNSASSKKNQPDLIEVPAAIGNDRPLAGSFIVCDFNGSSRVHTTKLVNFVQQIFVAIIPRYIGHIIHRDQTLQIHRLTLLPGDDK